MIHYLVAKYVDDLSRNEPINVGIVVYDGTEALVRFDGEREDGRLDRRQIINRISGSKAYRAWVDYWRAVLADPAAADPNLRDVPPGDVKAIEHLMSRPGRDFYLERGGTILMDADAKTLAETRDDLFARLVRKPDAPTPQSLRDKSKEALAAAGAKLDDEERFKEQVPVRLALDGMSVQQEVSYAVMNGDWHFLQEMPFDPGSARRSRKEANSCAFLFEHAADIKDGIVLYDGADIGEGQYSLLEMLMRYAKTVDVSDTDRAAGVLHERLALDEHE